MAAGWRKILTESNTATLTNKTIDADASGMDISNIAVSNMKASAIVIESETIASNDNDTTLATSAAIIDYVTTQTSTDLDVTSDSGSIDIVLNSETLSIVGTANEVETSATGTTVTLGLPNNVTIGNDLTVTGNLDVNGTTTTINTTNLEVSDTVMILHTGDTGAYAGSKADCGITFAGTNTGTPTQSEVGKLVWDYTGGNIYGASDTAIGTFALGMTDSITAFSDINNTNIDSQMPALSCGGTILSASSGTAYIATATPIVAQDGLLAWNGTDLYIYDSD